MDWVVAAGILLVLILTIKTINDNIKVPILIGSDPPKEGAELKTYSITDSEGNKEYIMTTKPLEVLLRELNKIKD